MSEYEVVAGTDPDPNVKHEARTVRRTLKEGVVHMMTEIEDGTFVAWERCGRCSKSVANCTCPNGPVTPEHIERWRLTRFEDSIRNRRPVVDLKPVLRAAQAAQDASNGDSNNAEIDLLRDALDEALGALGLDLPKPAEIDDDDDPEPEHTCNGTNPTTVENCPACQLERESLDEPVRLNDDGPDYDGHDPDEPVSVYDLIGTPDEDDLAWAREDLGPNATDDEVQTVAERRANERAREQALEKPAPESLDDLAIPDLTKKEADDFTAALGERTDQGLDAALERVRRAKEDTTDVGF